ncbi:hypothetical protein SBV1_2490004 [Verrucomicrobia bacterium]|nr:hypothetical protein SBV1_2490004 [Verrucomicrobiota bacterium]
MALRTIGPQGQPEKGGKYLFLVRLPRAAFRSCEHERAPGYFLSPIQGSWFSALRARRVGLKAKLTNPLQGRDASYRAAGFVGRGTWACARRTRSNPGYHITGFQPSEELSGLGAA